jgi:hypothetical protein
MVATRWQKMARWLARLCSPLPVDHPKRTVLALISCCSALRRSSFATFRRLLPASALPHAVLAVLVSSDAGSFCKSTTVHDDPVPLASGSVSSKLDLVLDWHTGMRLRGNRQLSYNHLRGQVTAPFAQVEHSSCYHDMRDHASPCDQVARLSRRRAL